MNCRYKKWLFWYGLKLELILFESKEKLFPLNNFIGSPVTIRAGCAQWEPKKIKTYSIGFDFPSLSLTRIYNENIGVRDVVFWLTPNSWYWKFHRPSPTSTPA